MRCKEAEMLLATRRDLPPEQEQAVQTHLRTCARCVAAWQREQRTSRLLQSLPIVQTHPAPLVTQQIRARLTRPPRRRTAHFALATVAALCGLILLSVIAAQVYPQTVRQAAVRIGLAANAHASASAQGTSSALPNTSAAERVASSAALRSGVPSAPAIGNGLPSAAQERLYIIKFLLGDERGPEVTGSRTIATDPTTGAVRYAIDGGSDAIVSPDRSRLYAIVGNSDGRLAQPQERVVAFDAHTGQEVWRSELITQRVMSIMGRGPSTLATSPDGRWLYIHSYDSNNSLIPSWLKIVDTTTGALLPDVERSPGLGACYGASFAAPASGNMLYITCDNTIQTFNVDTRQLAPFSLLESIVDSIMSPDKRTLYAFSASAVVYVIDPKQQRVMQQVDLKHGDTSPFTIKKGLIAVSGDGTTLVVGQAGATSELRVFDTRTWQERGRIQYKSPLREYTLAVNHDGSRVYAAVDQWGNTSRGKTGIGPLILLEFDTTTGQIVREDQREREEILRLFMGP